MSRRFDLQSGENIVERKSGVGILQAVGGSAPVNGLIGFAPGCVYHNTGGVEGTSLWVNIGTFNSSNWMALDVVSSGAGAPANGVAGVPTGTVYENNTGTPGSTLWVNVGNNTSTTWVPLDLDAVTPLAQYIALGNQTAGNHTLGAGNITGANFGLLTLVPAGNVSLITRTAAQMWSDLNNPQAGETAIQRIANANTAGNTTVAVLTLTAGANVTINGNATILGGTWRDFLITFNANGTTIQSAGTGTWNG
jgi:hypothetical protein